jgi:hypothetical protein
MLGSMSVVSIRARRAAMAQGHAQRGQGGVLGTDVVCAGPADYAVAKTIEHDGGVELGFGGGHVGQGAHPALIAALGAGRVAIRLGAIGSSWSLSVILGM